MVFTLEREPKLIAVLIIVSYTERKRVQRPKRESGHEDGTSGKGAVTQKTTALDLREAGIPPLSLKRSSPSRIWPHFRLIFSNQQVYN